MLGLKVPVRLVVTIYSTRVTELHLVTNLKFNVVSTQIFAETYRIKANAKFKRITDSKIYPNCFLWTYHADRRGTRAIFYCVFRPFILKACSCFDFTGISPSSYSACSLVIVLTWLYIFLNDNTLVANITRGRYRNILLLHVNTVIHLKAKKLSGGMTRLTWFQKLPVRISAGTHTILAYNFCLWR